ncbi:hypothetical protein CNMCM5793_006679 [Aspergillus hiratsukae]|uniref:Reverse transcriptase n=1 Tax=Aspergillus hiratsukae TaxID=1194566 RepID=A0A8H6UIS6_9EURO|nr:hypothetical protein CNMCM5793_006679 [Aspergillus hiratsukae]KAF7171684.1 hypothetical protein CNMCM6106_006072 [Aspergillus hiratsukae]
MADPPAGGPEPHPTNTQESNTSFSVEDFQPRVPEVWKLIDSLKLTIHHQTTLIEATKTEIEEVKHDQNILRDQNEKLHEEVRALRAQLEATPPVPLSRSWAAVAADGISATPQPNHRHTNKNQNCVRISTQRSFVDPADNGNSNGNAFGRYLQTDTANTHIRTALLNCPSTQDAQVAGIGTTKTGYVIRFKDPESAETARINTEWLNELGNNTKLVKPRFGVVVHRTPTEDFDLENANAEAIEKIMEENDLAGQGYQIEEVAWLKRKDKPLGKFASLGIWLDSPEGAERILNNGLLVGQRKHHDAAIVRAHTSGNDAHQESEPDASTAAANIQLAIDSLNIMKSGPGMEALINDHQSQNLDVLLIQEPSITSYRTHVNHSAWRLYRPTVASDEVRLRSLIYVNPKLSTSSHRQIRCDHPDITAIKIWTSDTQILLFSVYIPCVPLYAPDEASAEPTLTAIQDTISAARHIDQKPTSIILSGDFNRHHPMWGGNHIQPRFIEDASELITFFQDYNLHTCLPRGTATFWPLNDPGKSTTIDQTWSLKAHHEPIAKTRKAYERADWDKIGAEVLLQMGPWKEVKTRPALDETVERLTEITASAVENHIPNRRPTPYSKRWFTPDLKVKQTEVNHLRRKWQESCAERGRDRARSVTLFQEMQQKRRTWTRTIEKAKKSHWKQFLDGAGEGMLWKAATYMKPRETWGSIPALQVGSNELVDNEDKARAFLHTFFPKMDEPHEDPPTQAPLELPWPPITELEIERALRASKSSTAPGEDGLPTLVWKYLWKFLKQFVTGIFTASVKLAYHPKRWRRAKIVVLRKPGKPDYSNPRAYRPISLLNTLGKLLEAVIARRLSYLAEKHGLLPDTQFGGRPGRTTNKPCSSSPTRSTELGAFNGVNKISLDARLRAKGIPAVARKWIASFMSDRFANIGFDDFRTEVAPLDNAGLAQGSPLSTILFTFFNSDLVDQPVTSHGGASAFIDDYFRWRVGRSAEENLAKIQSEDIPRIEAWAQRTGSRFAAEKTELIHLTRKRSEQLQGQVVMNRKTIKPSPKAKLLGVIFDQELRWKEHVQQAIKRATKVAIALAGLRHLRPEQMRQIYQACVTPVVDYSSTVWHDPLRDKTHLRHLNTVQRVSLIRILSAFRTVATTSLEVEAHVLPTHLRLRYRAQRVIARLHTLPHSHPIRCALSRAQKRRNNIGTSSRFPLAEALKTMNLERLDELETIDPSPPPPWRIESFAEIEIGSDRETAVERAEATRSTSDIVVYSDASGREGHLGAAVVALDNNLQVVESKQVQVGPMDRVTHQLSNRLESRHKTATILCDSRSALQATQNMRDKSGQRIVHAIHQAATEVQEAGIALRLQWVPGHCDNPGNDAADQLAKDAACPGKTHPFRPLLSRETARLRGNILNQWEQEWKSSNKGGHLRKIDGTLPATYTRRLYGSLPRNRAYLLTQLRTGHNWLSTYAKTFGFRDDDKCVCGAQETVTHVLVDCPNLKDLRRKLRSEVGDAFSSDSSLLGGSTEGKKGKPDTVSRARTVMAVLDFAEASQRFRSRAPRGQPNTGSGN